MKLNAHAKINWTLDILGQRADGYHLMDMLMQPITLHDSITVEPAGDIALTVSGTPRIEADANNLAYRAAAALKKATDYPLGARIHVHKRIPSGAGLGGGSADAAGVLYGLNMMWRTGLDASALEKIGLTLGADVPFCLRGGLARVGGIGEKLTSLPNAPTWPLVIIQPCEGLSTAAVFGAYHHAQHVRRPHTEQAQNALLASDLSSLGRAVGNALEDVSLGMRPDIGAAIAALNGEGAIVAGMSGSGSAVFGAFEEAEAARRAAERLSQRWEKTFLCATCANGIDHA